MARDVGFYKVNDSDTDKLYSHILNSLAHEELAKLDLLIEETVRKHGGRAESSVENDRNVKRSGETYEEIAELCKHFCAIYFN